MQTQHHNTQMKRYNTHMQWNHLNYEFVAKKCRLLKLCTFLVANTVAQSYNSNSQQQSATSNLQELVGSLLSCSVLQESLWLEVWSVWFWSSDFAYHIMFRKNLPKSLLSPMLRTQKQILLELRMNCLLNPRSNSKVKCHKHWYEYVLTLAKINNCGMRGNHGESI